MTIRIGTSGWVYKHWRERFYPPELPQRAWFAHYAGVFDTVEINNSFYRLPGAETFDAWREQAPPGFLYAVKASRYLTHMKKLKDPEAPLQLFFERATHLGPTLGPILYQLPPHWHVNLARFEAFLAALPAGYRHAVEFRDESWLVEEVFRLLARHGVAHCLHDMPPLKVHLRVTAPLVYVRFHGEVTHAGDYPREALVPWAARLREWERAGHDAFVYFNNDPHGHALANAQVLRELCAGP